VVWRYRFLILAACATAALSAPVIAADPGTGYGSGSLPAMGAPVPPVPGFNSFGWAFAKKGGYGSSFSPSGGYGSSAGPSYNTGAGPATKTAPNYAVGFGSASGSLFTPGSASGTGGSNLGQGTSQNSMTTPNVR
jgi:hypothetical protein